MNTGDKRASNLLLYICIALAVVGIVLGGAWYSATHSQNDGDAIIIPTLLFLVSLLMFGMLVRDYYAHVKTLRLWWTMSLLFVAHLAAGAVLIRQHLLPSNYILWVLIILIPERSVFKAIIGALIGAEPVQYTISGKNRY